MSSSARPIAVLANATQYTGPACLLALDDLDAKVYAHDPSFTDEATRSAFEKEHNGVTAMQGDRLTVAAAALKETGRIDILLENSAAKGVRYETDAEDDTAPASWLADAATEMIVEPSRLLNYVSRVMRDQKSGAIVLFGSES